MSLVARELDQVVPNLRHRPLETGPCPCRWPDPLTDKVREGGRTINVHTPTATGVDNDAHRESINVDVTTGEDDAGWPAFPRGLVGRDHRKQRRRHGSPG